MNQSELAKLIGVSQPAVSGWIKDGMPSKPGPGGRGYRLDLQECLVWIRERGKAGPRLNRRSDVQARAAVLADDPLPASAPRSNWVFEEVVGAVGEVGPEAAAWLVLSLGCSPEAAADAWREVASTLLWHLGEKLGIPWQQIPDPPAPEVAAIAVAVEKLQRDLD